MEAEKKWKQESWKQELETRELETRELEPCGPNWSLSYAEHKEAGTKKLEFVNWTMGTCDKT